MIILIWCVCGMIVFIITFTFIGWLIDRSEEDFESFNQSLRELDYLNQKSDSTIDKLKQDLYNLARQMPTVMQVDTLAELYDIKGEEGMICMVAQTKEMYMYDKNWNLIGSARSNADYSSKPISNKAVLEAMDSHDDFKKIKKTKCDCCDAALPLEKVAPNTGLVKCEYCGSFNYVW